MRASEKILAYSKKNWKMHGALGTLFVDPWLVTIVLIIRVTYLFTKFSFPYGNFISVMKH